MIAMLVTFSPVTVALAARCCCIMFVRRKSGPTISSLIVYSFVDPSPRPLTMMMMMDDCGGNNDDDLER